MPLRVTIVDRNRFEGWVYSRWRQYDITADKSRGGKLDRALESLLDQGVLTISEEAEVVDSSGDSVPGLDVEFDIE